MFPHAKFAGERGIGSDQARLGVEDAQGAPAHVLQH